MENTKSEIRNPKHYDLEERTLIFTKKVIEYINMLPKHLANIEIGRQLIRSAGSIGANYIEANEALGKKDFMMRIRISKKEAKESRYWLLLSMPNEELVNSKNLLIQESTELMLIFGAILGKTNSKSEILNTKQNSKF